MSIGRIEIIRAVERVVRAAMDAFQVPVYRDRRNPLAVSDLPAVIVLTSGNEVVEEAVGGLQLRAQTVLVEAHETSKDGDVDGDVEDSVALLIDACRDALLSNRTLSGACLGLDVFEDADPPRIEISNAVRAAATTLRVVAYHT